MKQLRTFLKLALFKALLFTPVAAHAILGGGAGEFIENGTTLQDADFYVNTGKIDGNFEVVGSTALFRSTMTLSGARPVAMTAPLSGQVLKWNGSSWAPGTDNAGAGTTVAVKQDNSIFDAAVSTLDFASADFSMTDSPSGEVNFTLVATNPKFVQNRDTLQVGATSYVFNSTVDGFLTVISSYTPGQQFPVRFQGRAPPATNLSFPLGFYFLNSTNVLEEFAAIDAVTREVTTNTVNGKLRFKIASDSVEKTMLAMSSESSGDYVAFPTQNPVYFGTEASTGPYVKSTGSNLILSPGQSDNSVTLQADTSGISYSNGATGGRLVINKGTSATAHDGLVVISSQATQGSIDSLAHLVSLTTSYNEIMLWIQSNSASTLGANADIRIDANNPDIELQELDQLSPGTGNGKWEIAVNFDQLQFNQRNAADSSFQTLAAFARDGSLRFKELDNGGDFVGFIATNTLSSSFIYKLPSDNPAEGASLHTHAFAGGYYDMYWTKDVQNTNTLQAGTTFFVSAGRITSPLGSGATTFIVTQNDTSAQAIRVLSTGTANAVYIEDDGDAGSGSGSSGAVFINNTFNPGIALQIYSNNANPTSNAGMVFFKYANTGATKPLLRLDNFGTGPSLKIVENGNKGNTLSTSGSILVDNTQNTGIGIQVYSSTNVATGALLHLMADSTAWSSPIAVFESTSANSTAINLRLKDQNPDLEFQEIDQATPAGKYKIDVQSDQMRFLARNSADNAYELFAKMNPVRTGAFFEMESTGTVRFNDADNSRYVQFKASDTVVNNLTFVWPAADGTNGQALVTDGAGNLSFATISGAGGGSGDNLGNHVATMTITAGFGINATTITVPTINGDTTLNGGLTVTNTTTPGLIVNGSGSSFGGAFPTIARFNNSNGAPFNSMAIEFQSAGATNGWFLSGNNQANYFYSADKSKSGGFYFGGSGVTLYIGNSSVSDDGSGNINIKTSGGTASNVIAAGATLSNLTSASSLATDSGGAIIAGNSGILTATQTWSGANTHLSSATFKGDVLIGTSAAKITYDSTNGEIDVSTNVHVTGNLITDGTLYAGTVSADPSASLILKVKNNAGTIASVMTLTGNSISGDTWQGSSSDGILNIINGSGDAKFISGAVFRGAAAKGWTVTNGGSLDAGISLKPNSESRDAYINFQGGLGGDSSGGNIWYRPNNLFFEVDRDWGLKAQKGLRLYDSGNSNYVAFTGSATLSNTNVYVVPASSGTRNQAIVTDGSNNLFFLSVATAASSPLSLTSGNLTLGTVGIANGGTNITTYTQGDILYSDASNNLAKLAKDTNSTRYLSNTGTSNNPAWAQVNLANGVTGTLSDGSLSSNVDLLASTQTMSALKTFKDVVVQSTFSIQGSTWIIKGATYYYDGLGTRPGSNKILQSDSSGNLTWVTDQTSAGGGYTEIDDEGSALAQESKLNFIGAQVNCVDNSGTGKTDCTITGDGTGYAIEPTTVTVKIRAGLDIAGDLKTADYTVTSTDTVILASSTANTTRKITLPALVTTSSQTIVITKVDISTAVVMIQTNSSSDLIAGTTTNFYLYAPGQSIELQASKPTGSWWPLGRVPVTAPYVGFGIDPNSAAVVTASTTYCHSEYVPDFTAVTGVTLNVSAQALQSQVAIYDGFGNVISTSAFTTIGTGLQTINLAKIAYLMPGTAWVCVGSQSATTSFTRRSTGGNDPGACSFATSLPFGTTKTFAGCTHTANDYWMIGVVAGGVAKN